ncbi:MAG TPA: type IV toxin-antitoxin system AbiEi family antitoxin domain-containing protein [Solirubrobacteraceae bacterium]
MGAELRVFGARDQKIAMIAAAQRGRISRRQLHAAGISDGVISRLVRRGALIPLLPGVFAVGHLAPIEFGRETTALLAVARDAALSHHTAASLWGLRPAGSDDGVVHVLVRGGSASCPDGIRLHRTRVLERQDIRIRYGLPVTSPARTLVDLAGGFTDRQLEFAFDQVITLRIVRQAEIVEAVSRMPSRPGRAKLLKLAAGERGAPTLTRSEAEERFLALIRSAELPEPEVNARIHGYEVDFLWREQRLVVEIDGYRYHSTRRAFEHDRRKDATLHAAGLGTMRITWRQLEAEPFAVIARLVATMR